ncbi:MAG: hypothetical protein DMG19_04110 [Acidobacteria bacterium]|nr:MAG: hypothetical protein DMG19_04110 [Acidobacteriota bacterium]
MRFRLLLGAETKIPACRQKWLGFKYGVQGSRAKVERTKGNSHKKAQNSLPGAFEAPASQKGR